MIAPMINKATLFILSMCFAAIAAAQTRTVVKATVDKNRIVIGEQIELQLEADIPEHEPISFFSIDSIPHFEFVNLSPIDTTNTSSGTVLTQRIRITSFDSGSWVIPSFVMAGAVSTDSIPVEVGFSPFDPAKDYHDIKDVIDVTVEEKKQWWWWAISGGVVLVAVLLYLLLRKKSPPVKVVAPPVDPYKEALQQIEQLQRQKPATKAYYSQLVDIFRNYIEKRKGISSLQATTDDLVMQLRGIVLSKDDFEKLAQALRMSDFVKFAKYQPERSDDEMILQTIRQSIVDIEKTENEKVLAAGAARNQS
jgi:hypothetical protein